MYDGLGNAMMGALIIFLLIGVAIGGFLFWLLPIIWSWVKPWLHAITA
jgi:hypothetical protein